MKSKKKLSQASILQIWNYRSEIAKKAVATRRKNQKAKAKEEASNA